MKHPLHKILVFLMVFFGWPVILYEEIQLYRLKKKLEKDAWIDRIIEEDENGIKH